MSSSERVIFESRRLPRLPSEDPVGNKKLNVHVTTSSNERETRFSLILNDIYLLDVKCGLEFDFRELQIDRSVTHFSNREEFIEYILEKDIPNKNKYDYFIYIGNDNFKCYTHANVKTNYIYTNNIYNSPFTINHEIFHTTSLDHINNITNLMHRDELGIRHFISGRQSLDVSKVQIDSNEHRYLNDEFFPTFDRMEEYEIICNSFPIMECSLQNPKSTVVNKKNKVFSLKQIERLVDLETNFIQTIVERQKKMFIEKKYNTEKSQFFNFIQNTFRSKRIKRISHNLKSLQIAK